MYTYISIHIANFLFLGISFPIFNIRCHICVYSYTHILLYSLLFNFLNLVHQYICVYTYTYTYPPFFKAHLRSPCYTYTTTCICISVYLYTHLLFPAISICFCFYTHTHIDYFILTFPILLSIPTQSYMYTHTEMCIHIFAMSHISMQLSSIFTLLINYIFSFQNWAKPSSYK